MSAFSFFILAVGLAMADLLNRQTISLGVRTAADPDRTGTPRRERLLEGAVMLVVILVALALAGCKSGEDGADAYGNFEARETMISAEASGQLLAFEVEEGDRLAAGARVGLIDTTQLRLQARELAANREAIRTRAASVLSQLNVLEEQRQAAERERQRLVQLVEAEAATPQQLDQVEDQLRVLREQAASVRAQNASVLSDLDVLNAKAAQLQDRMAKSVIVNPVGGTVLQTYTEPYEVVAAGKPLYKIASLDTLDLRVYVSGDQLSRVRLGEAVQVRYDAREGTTEALPGTVSWVASQAEFTPRVVQTKEDRVNFVYAVKVRVPNPNGVLKIGMPGEVVFQD